MEVILLEKVRGLGALGDKVKVKSGYSRNYLVPTGKAVFATPANIAKFEARRAELEKAEAEALKTAKTREQALAALATVTVSAKAGDEGKLFGSLGTRDIAQAITDAGVAVEKHEVHMPLGLIRQIGEYQLEVELHSDVSVMVTINVVAEA